MTEQKMVCSECGDPIYRLASDIWDHVQPEGQAASAEWAKMARNRPCWCKAKPNTVPEKLTEAVELIRLLLDADMQEAPILADITAKRTARAFLASLEGTHV